MSTDGGATTTVRRRRLPFAIVAPHVIRDGRLSANARLLYAVLCTYANEQGDCWPSVSTVVDGLGLSDRSRRRAQQELIDAGVLTVTEQRDARGRKTLNLYSLTDLPEAPPEPELDPDNEHDETTEPGGTRHGRRVQYPARAPGGYPAPVPGGTRHGRRVQVPARVPGLNIHMNKSAGARDVVNTDTAWIGAARGAREDEWNTGSDRPPTTPRAKRHMIGGDSLGMVGCTQPGCPAETSVYYPDDGWVLDGSGDWCREHAPAMLPFEDLTDD